MNSETTYLIGQDEETGMNFWGDLQDDPILYMEQVEAEVTVYELAEGSDENTTFDVVPHGSYYIVARTDNR